MKAGEVKPAVRQRGAGYWEGLSEEFGAAWNRFWFTPRDPLGACLLRILAGLLALWLLLSYSADLAVWFAHDGLLPVDIVQRMTEEPDGGWNARPSYLFYAGDLSSLRLLHGAGFCVVLAFTAGLATRVTSVLTLAVVLSYVHRAPLITGPFEPVLTMLLCYLCLAPCGQMLSVDNWRRGRRKARGVDSTAAAVPQVDGSGLQGEAVVPASWSAGIALRLIQVHAAALYAMMGLTKLGGSITWWMGEGVWWLIARSDSRLVDWTSLWANPHLISFWSQGIVALEVGFALAVWNRWARPWLLGATTVHWLLIGLVTGRLSFAAAMLAVNLAFVPQEALRAWTRKLFRG